MPHARITKTPSQQEESAATVIFHAISISVSLIQKAGLFLIGLKATAGDNTSRFQNSGEVIGEFHQPLPIPVGLKQALLP